MGTSKKLEEFKTLGKEYLGQHMWATGYFCRTVRKITAEDVKK